LVLSHITGRTPGVLESLPHRKHHLGPADQRRTTPRRAHRLIGEGVHIVDSTAQRNEIRPGVAEGFGRPLTGPELTTDGGGLDSVFDDPRGDHASADRILVEHAVDLAGLAYDRNPSLIDAAK
jgi:hypothetical protein